MENQEVVQYFLNIQNLLNSSSFSSPSDLDLLLSAAFAELRGHELSCARDARLSFVLEALISACPASSPYPSQFFSALVARAGALDARDARRQVLTNRGATRVLQRLVETCTPQDALPLVALLRASEPHRVLADVNGNHVLRALLAAVPRAEEAQGDDAGALHAWVGHQDDPLDGQEGAHQDDHQDDPSDGFNGDGSDDDTAAVPRQPPFVEALDALLHLALHPLRRGRLPRACEPHVSLALQALLRAPLRRARHRLMRLLGAPHVLITLAKARAGSRLVEALAQCASDGEIRRALRGGFAEANALAELAGHECGNFAVRAMLPRLWDRHADAVMGMAGGCRELLEKKGCAYVLAALLEVVGQRGGKRERREFLERSGMLPLAPVLQANRNDVSEAGAIAVGGLCGWVPLAEIERALPPLDRFPRWMRSTYAARMMQNVLRKGCRGAQEQERLAGALAPHAVPMAKDKYMSHVVECMFELLPESSPVRKRIVKDFQAKREELLNDPIGTFVFSRATTNNQQQYKKRKLK